jgi:SdrD B-like protein
MAMVVGMMVVSAMPALAHFIDRATVDANCTGYTIKLNGSQLSGTTFLVRYTIKLVPPSGPTISIFDQTPVSPDSNGNFDQMVTKAWADYGVTLNNTYTLIGSATLFVDDMEENTIDIEFSPAILTCPAVCTGTIGDFVWNDANHNGIQDAGETGIGGVKLNLRDSQDNIIASTTTNASGFYQFGGLCPGKYTVEVDQSTVPAGMAPTTCMAPGSNPANDSNCTPAMTTLTNDHPFDKTIDFGYFTVVGKTFTIGPSSMEGHLKITAGDWISGGFSFKFKDGNHIATDFTVTSKLTLAVTCPSGGGPGGTILVDLGTKTYSVPTGNTNWLPTGDANSVLSWMGSTQAPDLCSGNPMDNAKGAVFTATVSQNPPTGSLVDFRFKYRDPNAKGKGNVNCLDTSDPRRNKADVCGASWSQTVTDP